MRKILSYFVLHLFFPVFFLGCATRKPSVSNSDSTNQNPESTDSQDPGSEALDLWNKYSSRLLNNGIQKSCQPRYVPAQGKYKGSVVLFHGYTACPQQFFELAEEHLAPAGFAVFLPLHPGHGQMLDSSTNKHKMDGIPMLSDEGPFKDGKAQKSLYGTLAHQMNEVMAKAKGERVVGGLSVGGAIASYALMQGQSIYNRAIIFAPFLDLSNKLADGALGALTGLKFNPISGEFSDIGFLNHKVLGWGPGCTKENESGRAGICDFKFSNILAALSFGSQVKHNAKTLPSTIQVQILASEADTTASPNSALDIAQKWGARSDGNVRVCLFAPPVPHSMLSRFDNPTENKSWLPDLLNNTKLFVTQSNSFFKTQGESSVKGGMRCSP